VKEKKKRGLIITGGDTPEKRYIEHFFKDSLIIAADSGFDSALEYGIIPDRIVGDFDSLKNKKKLQEIGKDKLVIYPIDKDETDTEIAINILVQEGIKNITILGGGGGRLDHLYALFNLFERKIHPQRWITDSFVITAIKDKIILEGFYNCLISLFPVGNTTCCMESEGLKWSLKGLQWNKGDMGVSNLVISDQAYIKMISGRLIMIHPLECRGIIRE